MGIKDDIKSLMAKEAVTMTEVASKLYNNSDKRVAMSTLSQKLAKETIKYKEILEIADMLDYDIEFKKRKK
ncbi:LLM class flavin-dependent oxidoreductase [bacterium]|nr:LLM class flavin-dependent oxidoreductase [bacterium]